VVGIIASFGAAAAVGVLLETFDPVLLSPAQMEAASDLPVLGSVPRIA
jgi:capsular polysaccharide biosynthesis protein